MYFVPCKASLVPLSFHFTLGDRARCSNMGSFIAALAAAGLPSPLLAFARFPIRAEGQQSSCSSSAALLRRAADRILRLRKLVAAVVGVVEVRPISVRSAVQRILLEGRIRHSLPSARSRTRCAEVHRSHTRTVVVSDGVVAELADSEGTERARGGERTADRR